MAHSDRACAHPAQAGPGAQLGNWLLEECLGEGRWSRVFRARPVAATEADADYVVKVPLEHHDSQLVTALLKREAQVGSTVSSPHLVPILSWQTSQPPCYLVMPYVAGSDLSEQLESSQSLSVHQAIWIARQVAEALVSLHDHGWIHADIKPSNIRLGESGHATLIDLGFARRLDSDECRPQGPLFGTPRYTAPERLSPHSPTEAKSDVYSLGVVMFEMLTGDLPSVMPRDRASRATDPRRLRAQIPHDIAHLVRQMLHMEPLRRPSAAEVVNALVAAEIDSLLERSVAEVESHVE